MPDARIDTFWPFQPSRWSIYLDLSISADSVDPDRINLFECWRDQQSWKAWRKIAKPPRVKLRESFVKLYRSDKAEKPF